MPNTFWNTGDEWTASLAEAGIDVDDEQAPPAAYEWRHREFADSFDFDNMFYRFMPRHGIYAASRWDKELATTGSYPALGSPDWEVQLKPNIGRNIGLVWEMKQQTAGTGKIKFYLKVGANRDILSLKPDTGAAVTEVSTTSTSWVRFQYVVRDLRDANIYANIADAEGEDGTFEIYLDTTSDLRVRNMRLYAGMSPFLNDGTAGEDGDYLR